MHEALREAVAAAIAEATGTSFRIETHSPAAGGSINETAVVAGGERRYFVKINDADRLDMFDAEAQALSEMAATETVRVPAPICRGTGGESAFLVLEYLDLVAANRDHAGRLGEALARLHRHTGERFGWHRDNTLGTTPQPNEWHADWIIFVRDMRLGHQLRLLGDAELSELAVPVLENLESFFAGYTPEPSLIHGDLWGGNWSGLAGGGAALYDPAAYYGDREMELAMTELFGGFPHPFRESYEATWPLAEGYERRKPLYLLYHVLNHANLFGGGYAGQARRLLERLGRRA